MNQTTVKPRVSTLSVVPTGGALGAEIRGPRIADMDEAQFARVREAWMEHLVLLFRDQHLTDPELLAFGKRFGKLDPPGTSIIGKPFLDDYPDILVISNIVESGVPRGNLGDGEAIWHTDMSYRPNPPTAAILNALEIPPSGGNTYWANQYLALERLPEELRRAVEGRQLNHDETLNSGGQLRKGFTPVTDPRTAPGTRHPIVRTHPETRRKALYLGRRSNAWIVDLPLDESEDLLNQLWRHATQPELVWGHEWRVGDVLIWDNRCTLHRRDSFDPGTRRLMHRVQIAGDRPV